MTSLRTTKGSAAARIEAARAASIPDAEWEPVPERKGQSGPGRSPLALAASFAAAAATVVCLSVFAFFVAIVWVSFTR